MRRVTIIALCLIALYGCRSTTTTDSGLLEPKIQLALDEYYDGIIKLQSKREVEPIDETRTFGRVENEDVILEYRNPENRHNAIDLILTIKSTGEQIEIVLPPKPKDLNPH